MANGESYIEPSWLGRLWDTAIVIEDTGWNKQPRWQAEATSWRPLQPGWSSYLPCQKSRRKPHQPSIPRSNISEWWGVQHQSKATRTRDRLHSCLVCILRYLPNCVFESSSPSLSFQGWNCLCLLKCSWLLSQMHARGIPLEHILHLFTAMWTGAGKPTAAPWALLV